MNTGENRMPEPQPPNQVESSATTWAALAPFIAVERRVSDRMAAHPVTAALYEFLRSA